MPPAVHFRRAGPFASAAVAAAQPRTSQIRTLRQQAYGVYFEKRGDWGNMWKRIKALRAHQVKWDTGPEYRRQYAEAGWARELRGERTHSWRPTSAADRPPHITTNDLDERTVAAAKVMQHRDPDDADAKAACALILGYDGKFADFWPRIIRGDTDFLADIPRAAVARKAARTETGKAASVGENPLLTDACHILLVEGAIAVQTLYEQTQRD